MRNKIRVALYEPDIAQNVGNILRSSACLGFVVDIIEPCGFIMSSKEFRRSVMDYIDLASFKIHDSFDDYLQSRGSGRVILATTKCDVDYSSFVFKSGDNILFGSESRGVPDFVHDLIKSKVTIKMMEGARSLNLASSVAIIASRALHW